MENNPYLENETRTILITGSSSGIGYQAALKMLDAGHRLILPCRNSFSSNQLLEKIENHFNHALNCSDRVCVPVIDLADLNSIEKCFLELISKNEYIDTLVLNAGLQYTGSKQPRWSKQGIELTFAVNHMASQYLLKRTLPLLSKSKFPRVVITSSEVHNPDTPGGRIGKKAGLAKLQGMFSEKGFSMIDGISEFDADKSYKDSKLCNVLFGQEAYKRLQADGIQMPVIAWAPGLVIPVGNGGFFRYSRKYNELGQRLFALFARDLLRVTETPQHAGELLKQLATSSKYSEPGFSYFSNRVISPGKRTFAKAEISNEASDSSLAKLLWEKTTEMIEISMKSS